MKISIAGAGIGGLAAGALLAQDGHDVTIYDQFEAPKPLGSGLVIQPVGREVLEHVGATTALAQGAPIARMEGIEADSGRQVLAVSYGADVLRHGLALHRASLHQSLLDAATAAGAQLSPGCRVKAFDDGALQFEDKPEVRADLVVDALGAGSVLSPLQARALPYGAVWASVPWPKTTDLPTDQLSQRYRSASRMAGILPIGKLPDKKEPMAAIFWSLPADAEEAWRAQSMDAWRQEVTALWPEAAPFFPDKLTHSDFTFARYSHGSLWSPVGDGIVHLGDAAHRASPQLGQGANMALLDAQALQLALRKRDEPLRYYMLARRWHVGTYQLLSRLFTPQYQSDSALQPMLRDRVLAPVSQLPVVRGLLTRLVCGDLVPPMPGITPQEGSDWLARVAGVRVQ